MFIYYNAKDSKELVSLSLKMLLTTYLVNVLIKNVLSQIFLKNTPIKGNSHLNTNSLFKLQFHEQKHLYHQKSENFG